MRGGVDLLFTLIGSSLLALHRGIIGPALPGAEAGQWVDSLTSWRWEG